MISVEGLCKTFTLHILGGTTIEAVRDVSFRVPEGGFLGLSGSSGAGKSTVLKCIYRTYLPCRGSVLYDSADGGILDLTKLHDREIVGLRTREIGYVSQFLEVIPRVPALELVMEPILARNGLPRSEAREQASRLLDRLRIPRGLFDACPATFSGGERQRVNIARGISWKPRLLLLDEPTASLDRESVDAVLGILKELRGEGTTMIGIFHDSRLMESIVDAVYRIG